MPPLDTNIEVHFFRGDSTKGQDVWMYSIRDSAGYRRGVTGAGTLIIAALKAACDIEGRATDFYYSLLDATLVKIGAKSR